MAELPRCYLKRERERGKERERREGREVMVGREIASDFPRCLRPGAAAALRLRLLEFSPGFLSDFSGGSVCFVPPPE